MLDHLIIDIDNICEDINGLPRLRLSLYYDKLHRDNPYLLELYNQSKLNMNEYQVALKMISDQKVINSCIK